MPTRVLVRNRQAGGVCEGNLRLTWHLARSLSPAMRLAYLQDGTLWLGGALTCDRSGGLKPTGSLPYV